MNVTQQMTSKIDRAIDAAFPFEVHKYPLIGPDNMPTPHYGLARTDRNDATAWAKVTVKKNYKAHTTDDVKQMARAAAHGFGVAVEDVEVRCSWKEGKGHRVAIRPTKEYRRTICHAAGDDNIFPQFIVRADYGAAFKASVGMYRDACKNMQMIRRVNGSTISLRHCGNFREHFDATVEEFKQLAAKYDSVVIAAETLAKRKVDTLQFLEDLYPRPLESDSRSRKTRHARRLAAISQQLEKDRQVLAGQDTDDNLPSGKLIEGYPITFFADTNLWELVNAVTGFVQHTKRANRGHDLATQAFLAVDDRECDKAWNLAMDMAT